LLGKKPVHSVVLLHSSTGSARQWAGLAEQLAPQYRVHAVDFHGHGVQSGWTGPSRMTLADDAALAAPLLAAPGGVHLVGHSYGGAVALKLATLHPQAVRSVTVYEPVLFRWLIDDDLHALAAREVVAVAEAVRRAVVRGDHEAAAERFIDFWSGAGTWALWPGGRREGIAARMDAVRLHFEALIAEPLRGRELVRLPMPMLCLSGTRTVAATRRIAALLRDAVPRARHELLPGLGHMGPVTHAALVNARIQAFLDDVRHAGVTIPGPGQVCVPG
jgi:pimeloyl-ACP methyl ester carboxylesterase